MASTYGFFREQRRVPWDPTRRGEKAWTAALVDYCAARSWPDEKVGGRGQLFERPPILDSLKVGTPLGLCEETAAGSGAF